MLAMSISTSTSIGNDWSNNTGTNDGKSQPLAINI
jgi:hypothetical protein